MLGIYRKAGSGHAFVVLNVYFHVTPYTLNPEKVILG